MMQRSFATLCGPAAIAFGLGLTGCAVSAVNLNPREIPSDHGAIYGRILAVDEGVNLTGNCLVYFEDDQGEDKGRLALDTTGWFFTTVKGGPTYLKSVLCKVTGAWGPKYKAYVPKIRFDVVPGDKIFYFGEIEIDMSALGPIGEGTKDTNGTHTVQSNFESSKLELQKRLGAPVAVLIPFDASPPAVRARASTTAPSSAAGFELREGIGAAEARCTGAGFEWQGLGDGRFSCSGAPVDLGVPLKVKLTACAGAVCEVAINASSDGASWGALTQRFTKLLDFVKKTRGDRYESSSDPLDDCYDELKKCFAAGRARTSGIWRWRDSSSIVSVVLDGGPLGGGPSLDIVYRVEAMMPKP